MDSCSNCPKRQTCRAVCAKIEAQLPKMWDGRDWIFSEPDAQERIEQLLINRVHVRAMLQWRHVLTPAQRRVFDLYYNDGLNQQEIAERLGMRRSSVDETLRRAQERLMQAGRKTSLS